MEYVAGDTLETIICATACSTSRVRSTWPARSATPSSMRTQGVLHRDLRPANVLVRRRGW